jgi:hypothetical protein
MATKELVKAEIETLTDEQINKLYGIIQDLKTPRKDEEKPKSFFEAIRGLEIDAPPDFSARVDEYLYGDIAKRTHKDE